MKKKTKIEIVNNIKQLSSKDQEYIALHLDSIIAENDREKNKIAETKRINKIVNKNNEIIELFGKDNFQELKILLRKSNDIDTFKEKIKVDVVETTVNYWIDYNFDINSSLYSYDEDYVLKCIEKYIKDNHMTNKFFLETSEKLSKFRNICEDKKINKQKLFNITMSVISEEDKIIQDIIE